MLMAGLDGIQNKIHPGEAMDKNLYDLPPEELKNVPTVCGSLREALLALEADHAFLLKGDVFSKDMIEAYIELKWEEVYAFEHTPHPIEFQMYYSASSLRLSPFLPVIAGRVLGSSPRTAIQWASTSPGCPGQAHGCPVEFLWTRRMALILLCLERLATCRDSKGQRHAAQE